MIRNGGFFRQLIAQIPFRGKKQTEETRKKEAEQYIRAQASALAEEMNFRLLCFQLSTCPGHILWVDNITVTEIAEPVKKSLFRRFWDKVMNFIKENIERR